MKSSVVSWAPGKIIITGEHSVVYGERALLASADLGVSVKVSESSDLKVEIESTFFKEKVNESVDGLVKKWGEIEGRREGEVGMTVSLGGVAVSLENLGDVGRGVKVMIDSELPMRSGMGSSASVATAVIGGVGRYYGKNWGLKELNEMVYGVEKHVHGNPSGADPTIVVHGGLMRFRKVNEKFEFNQIGLKRKLPEIVLVQSGVAVESTGEMVSMVKERMKKDASMKKVIEKMGKVSGEIIEGVERGKLDEGLIDENEGLLEELGVVGDKAKIMIKKIKDVGGVAKVCGAGGVKDGSGVLLAMGKNIDKIGRLIDKENWKSYEVSLGGEGWQIK